MALAAVQGEKTLAELGQLFDVHPSQIAQWRAQLLEGASGVFGSAKAGAPASSGIALKTLHAREIAARYEFPWYKVVLVSQ